MKIKFVGNDNSQTSLTSRTMKGVGWSTTSQICRFVFQFIVSAILARLLLPRDFGLIGMVAIFSGIIGMFSEIGLGAAIIQRSDTTEEHLSSVFWLNVVSGLVLMLIMMGLAPGIAFFYSEKQLTSIAAVLGIPFFLSSFGIVQRTLFTKQLDFKKLTIVEIVSMVVSSAIAISLAFYGVGVWSLVAQSLSGCTISVVLLWCLSAWCPCLLFKWDRIRELLGFSLNLLGFSFVNYFNRNVDNLLIGKFLGPSALGFYNQAYKLMLLPLSNISGSLGRVLFPAFSTIKNEHQKTREVYLRATRYISAVTFPIMLGLLVVAPEFILVVFGSKWKRSIFLLQVLCTVGIRQSIGATLGWIYLSQGRTDVLFKWGILSVSIIAASFFIGIRWDVEGAAIAYATAPLLIMFPAYYIPFRLINLPMGKFFRNFILTFTTSLGMMAIVFGLRFYLKHSLQANDVVTLFLCIGVGAVSYVGLLMLFGRQLLREIWLLMLQMKSSK